MKGAIGATLEGVSPTRVSFPWRRPLCASERGREAAARAPSPDESLAADRCGSVYFFALMYPDYDDRVTFVETFGVNA